MTIFSVNNLSKAFLDKVLFKGISFGMEEGERVGIIGRNGAGKSTFLKIIAGLEVADEGTVATNRELRIEYLNQLPEFAEHARVLDAVMDARPEVNELLREHARICKIMENSHDEEIQNRLEAVSSRLEQTDGWNLETEAKIILQKLGVTRFDEDVKNLSGGLRKRVALARVLLIDPDLLILDEPTNHLDADSVQWLQDRLQHSSKALLIVTHDRYFLDAVSNKIVELDQNKMFYYPGNYEQYLIQKEAYLETQEATADHQRNKLRQELFWLAKGAKARRTKQQSRIKWIDEMQNAEKHVEQKNIKIELGNSFLGSKVIDAVNISKTIGGKLLFKNFDYNAAPGDRIGIIGPNGTGKSTLLNTLAGKIQPDTGKVSLGATVKLGFFQQEIKHFDESQTVIGSLREIAEFIDTGVGKDRFLTAKDLLERFLFPAKQQHSRIETLSGGERRRLALLHILMDNPNVLLLDEPTNDFDVATLSALEDYLRNFLGALIVVSHDRSFLDNTVEHIFAFEEGGVIKKYPGNYSAYLEKKEARSQEKAEEKVLKEKAKELVVKTEQPNNNQPQKPKKLSFKEQQEFKKLEEEIAQLEKQKAEINEFLSSGGTNYKELDEKSKLLKKVEERLDEAEMRWLELSEIAG
ncbi:MAG TPA: ABC-F family ATP-binding cassette domain-containing protein [Patescibacteria group bacterium]|nr:ABC-F family ATP-binding cassette domain-containing protein [Patescibacteria group bacterium]